MKTIAIIFKNITLVVLLAILLLFVKKVYAQSTVGTGNVYNDKIVIDHVEPQQNGLLKFSNHGTAYWESHITYDGEYPNGTLRLSCPDGYKLEGRIYDRLNGKDRCRTRIVYNSLFDGYCLNTIYTDAEIKCVKE